MARGRHVVRNFDKFLEERQESPSRARRDRENIYDYFPGTLKIVVRARVGSGRPTPLWRSASFSVSFLKAHRALATFRSFQQHVWKQLYLLCIFQWIKFLAFSLSPPLLQVYMFCGEIATRAHLPGRRRRRDAVGWGLESSRRCAQRRAEDEVGFVQGRTCSRGRRRWRCGGAPGWDWGGFCLRHCAISSRWLNRFLSLFVPFSYHFFRFFHHFVLLIALLASSPFSLVYNALFSLSPSSFRSGDAAPDCSCQRWLTRSADLVPRCHASALRLEASTFLHFPVRHARAIFSLFDPWERRQAWDMPRLVSLWQHARHIVQLPIEIEYRSGFISRDKRISPLICGNKIVGLTWLINARAHPSRDRRNSIYKVEKKIFAWAIGLWNVK